MIDKNIIGYEFVKNVVSADGYERTGCDYLFAVRRNCNGNYLDGLCEVRKNKGRAYEELEEKYPFETHIVWFGGIYPNYDYKKHEFLGTDRIEFHWG